MVQPAHARGLRSPRLLPVRAGYPDRVAAIEFGGTKVLVAAGRAGEFEEPLVRLVTGAPLETLGAVIEALKRLEERGEGFQAIGIAAFGPLELDRASPDFGRLLNTPKSGWAGFSFVEPLRRAFSLPIVLETDVNAAAIAEEFHDGGAHDDHAYITVGTGVGVGLVANGRSVHGSGHPEAGHLLVRPFKGDTFPGVCFAHGACVEGMISGPALAERLGQPLEELDSGPEIWALAGDYLAQLCMALVLTVAPQRIVLGGGVGSRPELLEPTRRHLAHHLGGYLERYRGAGAIEALLVPAALTHSGLCGALLLASAVAHSRALVD